MKKIKEEHKEYRVRSFRLNDKTLEKMQTLRGCQSWNLFFLQLIKSYEKPIHISKDSRDKSGWVNRRKVPKR